MRHKGECRVGDIRPRVSMKVVEACREKATVLMTPDVWPKTCLVADAEGPPDSSARACWWTLRVDAGYLAGLPELAPY